MSGGAGAGGPAGGDGPPAGAGGPAGDPVERVGSWTVRRSQGGAGAFHDRELPDPVTRSLWLLEVDRPALVLGAAQQTDDIDTALAATRGIEVVRRRSGGSAVLLEPGRLVWADFVIGRDDPLWDDDIGRAAWWVGRCWQEALTGLGFEAAVHRGAMQPSAFSDRICFTGLGPGEVLIDGRKVVGVSQRRTRGAARFQTGALLHWDPALLAALCRVVPLGQPPDPALAMAAVGVDRPAEAVIEALIAALPD